MPSWKKVITSGSNASLNSLTVVNGITGSLFGTASFAATASFALNAGGGTTINTGSFVTTSSFNAFTSSYNTGSFTGSFTGSLFGTASFAQTASFVTPLNQNVIITGSLLVGTGSSSTAPVYGLTPNLSIGMNTGSTGAVLDLKHTSGSVTAGDTLGTIQFSALSVGGTYNVASSQIRATSTLTPTFGNSGGGNLSFWTSPTEYGGDLIKERMRINTAGQVLIGLTSSLDTTSKLIVSGSTAITGSLSVSQGITGSLFGTASFASNVISSSFAQTASFAPNYLPLSGGVINGNVTVNGTASISFLNVTIESASVIYSSGSNQFGDATNDIQTLIGTVIVSGSQKITGSLDVNGSTLIGTGSSIATPAYGFTPNLSIGMNTGSTGAVLDLKNTSGSILTGDTLGTIQFSGKADGTNGYVTSQIRSTVTSTVSTGNAGGGNIAIWTGISQAGSSPVERMRVNSNGQVLIGLTSSLDTTSKLIVSGSTAITGSLNVTQGITGSLFGTASWANNATSASYALTASFALNAGTTINTGSFVTTSSFNSFTSSYNTGSFTGSFTGSLFGTASFATTASYALNGGVTQIVAGTNVTITNGGSGSVTINAAGSGGNIDTGSFATTGSNTFIGNQIITGSLNVTQGITGSLFGTASFVTTASYVENAQSASYVLQAVSSSFASTASLAPNYQLTSGTGSMLQPYVLTSTTSSMSVATASYVENAQSASYVQQAVSSSFATTASYASNGGVTSIVAGTNITISSATGSVTINSTGGGGGGTDLGLVQAMTLGLQNIF
jgi:hypothetical protein